MNRATHFVKITRHAITDHKQVYHRANHTTCRRSIPNWQKQKIMNKKHTHQQSVEPVYSSLTDLDNKLKFAFANDNL